jgi:hypothetical protein
MKTILVILVSFFLIIQTHAQFTINLKGEDVKTGQKIEFIEVSANQAGYFSAVLRKDGEIKNVGFNELKKITFTVSNIKEFWINQAVINEVYESLANYGMQYSLRKGWEEEALQYLNELEQRNLIFNDS